MSELKITVFQPDEPGAARLIEHIANVTDQIRQRAFELSTMDTGRAADALADWMQAEHELFACQRCEVREEANQFVTEIDAAEFEPMELKVSLLGNDLMIEGTSRSENKVEGTETESWGRSIKVRVSLSDAFDPATLKAALHAGVLRVTADKRHAD